MARMTRLLSHVEHMAAAVAALLFSDHMAHVDALSIATTTAVIEFERGGERIRISLELLGDEDLADGTTTADHTGHGCFVVPVDRSMSAWGNRRPIQNDRTIGVGNQCTGAAECIELHVEAADSRQSLGRRLIEVHMDYADTEWLIRALTDALDGHRAENAEWATNPAEVAEAIARGRLREGQASDE